MAEGDGTRASLLIRVRDPADRDAWRQFVDLYGPLIFEYARKKRLQDADAADLTQIVLQEVSAAIGRFDYDPARGTFRGWLLRVVRNQLHKLLAGAKRTVPGSGDSAVQVLLENQPQADEAEDQLWEQEYQRQLFLQAADAARPHFEASSWQAFWRTAVEGNSAAATAAALGMTVGAVYTAKSRVLDAIRQHIERLRREEG